MVDTLEMAASTSLSVVVMGMYFMDSTRSADGFTKGCRCRHQPTASCRAQRTHALPRDGEREHGTLASDTVKRFAGSLSNSFRMRSAAAGGMHAGIVTSSDWDMRHTHTHT